MKIWNLLVKIEEYRDELELIIFHKLSMRGDFLMVISGDKLKNNQEGIVQCIHLNLKKQAKLSHLGLVKGARLQRKYASIFQSPICFQIYSTMFGLREEDASKIEVEV